MYDQPTYYDIALTLLILFLSLFALLLVMKAFTRAKRRRKRLVIEYGIKVLMRQVRGDA